MKDVLAKASTAITLRCRGRPNTEESIKQPTLDARLAILGGQQDTGEYANRADPRQSVTSAVGQ